ncbi:DgyrCDS6070 [Dimorphilus gyrociliatus]|nr:DgyrCDS6070 [Dimorphilus gyrociliatus]
MVPQQMGYANNEWIHGLCSCFDNIPGCLAACFCYPIYQCYVTCQLHEEALCLLAGQPATWTAVRAHIRGKFNIHGSICGDCIINHLCPCCVLCQVRNEWESRHKSVGVVMQQQAPIVMQTTTTTTNP